MATKSTKAKAKVKARVKASIKAAAASKRASTQAAVAATRKNKPVKPATTKAAQVERKKKLRPSAEEIRASAQKQHQELRDTIAAMIAAKISPATRMNEAVKLGTRVARSGTANAGGANG
jgi:hypothetical protein